MTSFPKSTTVTAIEAELLEAAYEGRLERCREILEVGVNLDAAGLFGETAVQSAVEGKQPDVLRLLLAHRPAPDLNLKDNKDETALIITVKIGHPEMAHMLLDAGADIDLPGQANESPLYQAVEKGNVEMAELLLARGADPNVLARNGRTALHCAASHGHEDLCLLLIQNGADAELRAQGAAAATLARLGKHKELAETLKSAAAAHRARRQMEDALPTARITPLPA